VILASFGDLCSHRVSTLTCRAVALAKEEHSTINQSQSPAHPLISSFLNFTSAFLRFSTETSRKTKRLVEKRLARQAAQVSIDARTADVLKGLIDDLPG
jgi:hypothetical protein